jgi:hypothetical protein
MVIDVGCRMAQRVQAVVVLTAVNFVYIDLTAASSRTNHLVLVYQFYAICNLITRASSRSHHNMNWIVIIIRVLIRC